MKVILYMAISANGMIARKNDKTDWSVDESNAYREKVKECGNLVIGRRTYELMQEDENKDADTDVLGNPVVIVLTGNSTFKDKKKAKFVKTPKEAIDFLEQKGFETAMVAGGSKVDTAFLKEGLVDEIYLDIEPLIFGKGIPLFIPADFEYRLKLLEVKKLSDQTIQLHYLIEKNSLKAIFGPIKPLKRAIYFKKQKEIAPEEKLK